ncbi:MAG TPA: hypothetical protein VKO42_00440 [Patescibacteria group bacterium]|nr:hypothetical protein [Patescibacteria group bacterium]
MSTNFCTLCNAGVLYFQGFNQAGEEIWKCEGRGACGSYFTVTKRFQGTRIQAVDDATRLRIFDEVPVVQPS